VRRKRNYATGIVTAASSRLRTDSQGSLVGQGNRFLAQRLLIRPNGKHGSYGELGRSASCGDGALTMTGQYLKNRRQPMATTPFRNGSPGSTHCMPLALRLGLRLYFPPDAGPAASGQHWRTDASCDLRCSIPPTRRAAPRRESGPLVWRQVWRQAMPCFALAN
jgi:hypothetical protein